MAFLSRHIAFYKSFYIEKSDESGYFGMQSLTDNKKFVIFLGPINSFGDITTVSSSCDVDNLLFELFDVRYTRTFEL